MQDILRVEEVSRCSEVSSEIQYQCMHYSATLNLEYFVSNIYLCNKISHSDKRPCTHYHRVLRRAKASPI